MVYRYMLLASLVLKSCVLYTAPLEVETIVGKVTVSDPLVQQIIEHPMMQRMKKVDQSGSLTYFGHAPAFSRFDHCVGVWALLSHFGCSQQECLVGLMHDASHTAFSHVGDYLFGKPEDNHAYQDTIHLRHLEHHRIPEITKVCSLPLEQLDPDCGLYTALERSLPDLCADRIEYTLHTALIFDLLTQNEVRAIINDLRWDGKDWYFVNASSARKFADLTLHFTTQFWGVPWNQVINHYTANLFKRAIDLKLITAEMMHHGVDCELLEIVKKSEDAEIRKHLDLCARVKDSFSVVAEGKHDKHFAVKFRGVNPWIESNGKRVRLNEIDTAYAAKFAATQASCKVGVYIKFN